VGSVVDAVGLLAPLAADRAGSPPTSSSLADKRRVGSLLLSTAARDPLLDCSLRAPDCSLRSLRIALGSRLLRRRSPTKACRLASPQHGGARSAQRSQLTAEPRASPAFARTRRSSRARRSASKEEMLDPSSSKAASQAASSRAARSTVARWRVL
jgi:hypothetical protein